MSSTSLLLPFRLLFDVLPLALMYFQSMSNLAPEPTTIRASLPSREVKRWTSWFDLSSMTA